MPMWHPCIRDRFLAWADSTTCCLQTAEMQKTLGSLKDALATLEKGKAPAEAPKDSITLTDLRSELRVLASSLNECVPGPPDLPIGRSQAGMALLICLPLRPLSDVLDERYWKSLLGM